MSEQSDNPEEVEISLEAQAHGGELKRAKKKLDPVALSMYGDRFTGYQKVGEILDLIPVFKEYYYAEKIKNPNAPLYPTIKAFNEESCYPEGKKFHPYPTQLRHWRKKWDLDLMNQREEGRELVIYEPKKIKQVIKTRGEGGELILGADYGALEQGVGTLAGELINDAAQMLRDDQELEDIYSSEELMKRRAYIVNVFAHTTKLVHGKAALMLKASAEKRENANFLMGLLAKATSGKLSDEEMSMLETTYTPQPQNEQPAHA